MKNIHPDELYVALIQPDILWEDKEDNLTHFAKYIDAVKDEHPVVDLVILPEMFSTGFTMNPEAVAETMEESTVEWMKETAAEMELAICGSLVIRENGQFFNRFLFVTPDHDVFTYDKKHLFAFAGENEHYQAGTVKTSISYRGWTIQPFICYDLRFPVWCRSTNGAELMIFVANWPETRIAHWKCLLQARAIENQCYVIGVNRVGTDANDLRYPGDSSIIDPLGNTLLHMADRPGYSLSRIHRSEAGKIREKLPFLKDADRFSITD